MNISEKLALYEGATVDQEKDHYARLLAQGYPVFVYPHMLQDLRVLGFEEDVHFLVSRPIPNS